jgi:hypothetical protein
MASRSAARFTAGDSIQSTRTTRQMNKVAREPRTSGTNPGNPRAGNTMNGMPGFIRTGMKGDSDGARGGKTISPKGPPGSGESAGERYIGKRGRGSTINKVEGAGRDGSHTGTMGTNTMGVRGGHRGSMEQRLSGKTKSFGERKRSNMY